MTATVLSSGEKQDAAHYEIAPDTDARVVSGLEGSPISDPADPYEWPLGRKVSAFTIN